VGQFCSRGVFLLLTGRGSAAYLRTNSSESFGGTDGRFWPQAANSACPLDVRS